MWIIEHNNSIDTNTFEHHARMNARFIIIKHLLLYVHARIIHNIAMRLETPVTYVDVRVAPTARHTKGYFRFQQSNTTLRNDGRAWGTYVHSPCLHILSTNQSNPLFWRRAKSSKKWPCKGSFSDSTRCVMLLRMVKIIYLYLLQEVCILQKFTVVPLMIISA